MLGRLLNTITSPFYKTKWTFHLPRRKPDKPLQVPFLNWKIVKGDMVKVRTGDDKGKIGKVLKVLRKLNRVVVNKINVNSYTKQLEDGKTARLKKASSIHISNVGMYDPTAKKAVRVVVGYHPDTGELLRVSKKTGRVFSQNRRMLHLSKREVRGKSRRVAGVKDTPYLLAHKVTYEGQDFQSIRREFLEFIAAKEAREKLLVFKE